MPDLRSVNHNALIVESNQEYLDHAVHAVQTKNSSGNNEIKAKLGINKQILTYLLLKDHNFAQRLIKF